MQRIKGLQPNINDNSVRIFDHLNQAFYFVGGCRWKENLDLDSPTRSPRSDFFKLDLTTMEWRRLTVHTRFEALVQLPVISLRTNNNPNPNNQPTPTHSPKPLPALSNAMGYILHDRDEHTGTPTAYLLLFGGRTSTNTLSSDLICINLTTLVWRKVLLDGARGVAGRAGGTMLIAQQRLCVFGGWTEDRFSGKYNASTIDIDSDDDDGPKRSPCDTFAVADLAAGKWILPNATLPDIVGPLGFTPGAIAAYGGRKIILLRGQEDLIVATFHTVFVFDPLTLEFEVRSTAGNAPEARDAYCFQSGYSDSSRHGDAFLAGWNHCERSTADSDDPFEVRHSPTHECAVWRFNYVTNQEQGRRRFEHEWVRVRVGEAVADMDATLSIACGSITGAGGGLLLLGHSRDFLRASAPQKVYNAVALVALG